MNAMPKQTVFAAAGVMILAAAIGVYIGVSRSLASPTGLADEAGVIVPAVTPVASAKPILTPAPTMDEAEVRKLAREEAQAVLVKSSARKAAEDDSADDSTPEQLTPVAPALPPAPAPAHPTTSSPTPG
jgi:hypothetical protein